ncbi:ribonuclease activity regulator RraA [Phyllobacterium sp. 21LDTY02-6]|uniref:ribonuclease activity regulator RraA n=1 Tax=unclassified Phyllobacterium TaxID=2638441 RepID=UPI0020207F67|nr:MULTISPECIES: ribonuclease activity regulator RraA [unclassified Phyllobacterium]MCO4318579.1 ribonuclease activity regulator RraA [Phyllobacterium sp. 21LDTY02-6]MCX8281094.1 ribonuclease activity regulator RraA [Phyllobacterium sp. 0TCS1.6C]MCX8294619.1 ribonuclease activity regulator RraA [Phyllobacterium sp. 0TCS1.6A]
MQSPADINDITRPARELCDALAVIGTATASSELSLMGIRDPQIRGPLPLKHGRSVAGPALTLQCMPKREDLYGSNEYDNPELQLHRHVLYPAQTGDMVVVDARGDMASGIFGEMMLTFLAGRGGAGIVVDGCIRDSAKAKELDLGIWVRGVTPNYHAQTGLIPFAVNVPVACGGVLVMPGDIIVADDDGVIVVPVALAAEVIARSSEHAEWEEFARFRLSQGGDLRKYYPLTEGVQDEYVAWRNAQPAD